jgi:hypothetical protein
VAALATQPTAATATSKQFPELLHWEVGSRTVALSFGGMSKWTFLTNHARALVCIAHDPGMRLREIAAALDVTERSAYAIVSDLADAGYVVKHKDGRRNRYQIQKHLPLREADGHQRTIGEILDVFVQADAAAEQDSGPRVSAPMFGASPA